MEYFLWTLCSLVVALFLHDFVIIPALIKFRIWKSVRIVKKIKAKHTDKETLKLLDEVIEVLKNSDKDDDLCDK